MSEAPSDDSSPAASPSMSVVQALASGVDVAPSEDGKYPVKGIAEIV